MRKLRSRIQEVLRRAWRREDGQSIVIVAAAMIGLIAFAGVVTDAALVYVHYGHLRRAADAAAVSAAGQMREGRSIHDITQAARNTIAFHNLEPGDIHVFVPPYIGGPDHYEAVCAWWDAEGRPPHGDDGPPEPPPAPAGPGPLLEGEDPSLCTFPPRKLVRVDAEIIVNLAFLNILGFSQVGLEATAQSEAATLDVALVLDRSWSMAWDTPGGGPGEKACWDSDGNFLTIDCWNATIACNDAHNCQPMAQVKDAALRFVDRLQPPFDRASVITFDRWADVAVPMTSTLSAVQSVLLASSDLHPSGDVFNDEVPCRLAGGDIWECANTNLGLGLGYGNNQFTHWSLRRDESVWVMIVLGDGGANVALGEVGSLSCPEDYSCCPADTRFPASGGPFCRDDSSDTRHCGEPDGIDDCRPGGLEDPADWPANWGYSVADYDSDDFARDMADFAGLKPPFGNYIVMFSIGLGDDVTEYGAGTDPPYGWGDPDAGEQILRYIANVGYNGEFNTGLRDLCDPVAHPEVKVGDDCGNYFYAPTAAGLDQIFSEIASRIFTRLTQ